ncbi:hypothetical protein [Nitrosopumilus sp.]|uniref:hypothetical protein n=1 Tax=Nitrosopumilus sp. TaxID=2024843 RepID=UPI0034A09E8D
MRDKLGFRGWFYFRQGWTTYFAFIFAAINTMTVTYYLAIENIPLLKSIFPTFYVYLVVMAAAGIPLLVFIGYIHFKRTSAYKAEADIYYESNPFALRTLVNSEVMVSINLKLIKLLVKMNNNEKISEEELKEINQMQEELLKFTQDRTIKNNKDLEFFKKI